MNRAKQRVYRFALYGRSGSGKSCMLGTLALGAVGHPGGFSVQRMPVTVPRPDGDKSSGRSEDAEAAGLHEGREWIDKAKRALEQHDVPPPNPPTFGDPPLLVDFKIGSPDRGDFLVRTIDYSGELINPEEEHVSESTVNELKKCLKEFDGFVVLAEIPRDDGSSYASVQEIRLLKEAFASLREQQESSVTPVAVVLTKWDRYSKIDFDDPNTERRKLQEFLESNSVHSSLVDTIRNAVTEQQGSADLENEQLAEDNLAGLPAGNCRVFPASSFGRSVRQDGRDLPKPDGLRPYGLLDPFVWLAERRDALDAVRIGEEFDETGPIGDVLLFRFLRYLGILRRSRALRTRMPRHSPAAQKVRQIYWGALKRFSLCFLVCLIVAAGIVESGWELLFRKPQFDDRVAVVENPQATEEKLLTARQWFDDYRRFPWNGIFFAPSPKDATRQMEKIDNKIEEIYGEPVLMADTPEAKAQAAREYIDKLPHGRHAAEAKQSIEKREQIIKQNANEDWLAARKQQANAAIDNENVDKMEQILGDFDRFPHPKLVSTDQLNCRRDLREKLKKKIAAITSRKDWSDFVEEYNTALTAGKFVEASSLLTEWNPRDEKWHDVAEKFSESVPKRIESQMMPLLRDHYYSDARLDFKNAMQAMKKIEEDVRRENPDLAEAMLESQRKLNKTGQLIVQRQDEYLYEKVQKSLDRNACRNYLDNAPIKSMEGSVSRYLDYLNSLDKPLDITISCKIFWDKNYATNANDHVLTVRVDDREVLQVKSLTSTPNNFSGEIGRISLRRKKLDTSIKFRAKIIEDDLISDDDAGKGKRTYKLFDLQKWRIIPLKPSDGSGFTNQFYIKIVDGIPNEPELPKWTSK